MSWLVRYRLRSDEEASRPPNLLDHHAALVATLWDLGTTGVAEQATSLVAGFDRLETANAARSLAERHGLVAAIETVDDRWVRHDIVDVVVTTPSGTDCFPVVAGAAFGHGGHPTTRLCLDLMSSVFVAAGPGTATVPPRSRVLDLGTGSGVLAIAAHHLGATDITASDVDPVAIDWARRNTDANGVELQLIHGDVDVVAARADQAGADFDLIVANVLAVVHEQVAPTVGSLLGTDGVLVVAGFLADQADRVAAAYRVGRPALQIIDCAMLDDWCGLVLAETSAG